MILCAATSWIRRAGLLGLAALLIAAAAIALASPPARAEEPPPGFTLNLDLFEDSDNIVPTNSIVKVTATFDWVGAGQGLPKVTDIELRTSGAQEWENSGRGRVNLVDQFPGTRAWVGSLAGNDDRFGAGRLDGRTLVVGSARHDSCAPSQQGCYFSTGDVGIAYLYDFKTRREVTQIRPEVFLGYQQKYFGESKSISVWEDNSRGENKEVGYIFLGGREWYPQGEKSTKQWTGRLFIFKVDWGADEPELQMINQLGPPNPGIGAQSRFGQSVEISRDGQTLVVSAPIMEEKGAVFVFEKPDDGWENLEFSDGARLDVVPGHPRTGTDLDKSYLGAQFGKAVAISANGDTIVAGAFVKEKKDDNSNIDVQFTALQGGRTGVVGRLGGAGNWRYSITGEAQIFVRPSGGWADDSTPDRIFRAEQSAGTAYHSFQSFGEFVDISPDGDTIAVTASGYAVPALKALPSGNTSESTTTGYVYLWEKPGSGWGASVSSPSYNQTRTSPSATIPVDIQPTATFSPSTASPNPHGTYGGEFSYGGLSFNKDGTRLVISDTKYHDAAVIADRNYYGRAWIFEKPEAGWDDADTKHESATLLESPRRRWSGFFGEVTYDLDGEILLSYADQRSSTYRRTGMGPGRLWTFDEDLDLIAGTGGCTRGSSTGDTTWSCPLNLEYERPVPASMETFDPVGTPVNLIVPIGTPNGTKFTISAAVTVDGQRYTDILDVQVGEVNEATQAEFNFGTRPNGQPYTDIVATGESTTLVLKVLNENGGASAKGAISSVLFTTTRGSLSARLGDATAEACLAAGRPLTCQLASPDTAVTAGNSDNIRLTISHPGPGKGGRALVQANVVGAGGQVLAPEPIWITFAGAARDMTIAEPPTTLLGYVPARTTDQRNRTTLVVSATDENGNRAAVPDSRHTAKLTGPDGKTLALTGASRRVNVEWPLRKGGTGTDANDLVLSGGNPQARVTILADDAAPLAAGEYTLELGVGSGSAKLTAKQTFSVAGGAAAVALTTDPEGEVTEGASVTVTAAVTDASGSPVPDGTPVTFAERSTGASVALVLLSPSRQLTRDGEASVTLRAVGIGGAYVTAEADDVSGVLAISVAAASEQMRMTPLTSTQPNAFTVWAGVQVSLASRLLTDLEGIALIYKWTGREWIIYGQTDTGRTIPGSIDFPIARGEVLWLSSG